MKNNFSIFAFMAIFLILGGFLANVQSEEANQEAQVQPEGVSPESQASQPDTSQTSESITETSSQDTSTILVNLEEVISQEQSPSENQEITQETLQANDSSTNSDQENTSSQDYQINEEQTPTQNILINLDEISSGTSWSQETPSENQSEEQDTPQDTPQAESQVETISLYENGKLQMEVPEEAKELIRKETIEQEDNKKIIKVYSLEHISQDLEIYEDLPREVPEEDIQVYWQNEERNIDFESYDVNSNGLVDRISWTVPHLSEQYFEIILSSPQATDSSSLIIQRQTIPSGEIENPANFSFKINYTFSDRVKCSLTLSSGAFYQEYNLTSSNSVQNLENGNYHWNLYCLDPSLPENNASDSGTFSINENFQVLLQEKLYLLEESISYSINSKSSQFSAVLKKPDNSKETLYTSASPYVATINKSQATIEGLYELNVTFYRLAKPLSIIKNFSVARAELIFNKNKTNVGEEVIYAVKVNSPIEKISSLILDFGDSSSNITYYAINENSKNINFYHKYSAKGTYTVELKLIIDGRTFNIRKNGIEVLDARDSTAPEVTLIYPNEDQEISNKTITFSYRAEDTAKINNCTIELYNFTGAFETLDFKQTVNNIANNQRIETILTDFKDGGYVWRVFCCDNSSNCNGNFDYESEFIVRLSNTTTNSSGPNLASNQTFEKKDEMESLNKAISSFLEKKKSFSLSDIEALDELGISGDLEYLRKRIVQIDQDLNTNLKYVTDANLKEKRKLELYTELESMKSKIPLDFKVEQEKEFAKNTVTKEFSSIIEKYLQFKGSSFDEKKIKKLAELNQKAQKDITVSTKARNIRIVYNFSEKELTLVTKTIDVKNDSFEIILESIPKSIAQNASDIKMITKSQVVNADPLLQILVDDLVDSKLVYYVEKKIDLKEIENSDTLLFKEFSISSSSITGFVILESGFSMRSLYIALFIFLAILLVYVSILLFTRIRLAIWRKEANVLRIFDLIKESKKSLRRNEMVQARESYHKVKQVYPLIPRGCQKYLYKEIKSIRVEIDKRDISNLIMEYEEAKIDGREKDVAQIYRNMKEIYKRLPRGYQRIIYDKIFSRSEIY